MLWQLKNEATHLKLRVRVDRMVWKEGRKGKFFVIKIQYEKINNNKKDGTSPEC